MKIDFHCHTKACKKGEKTTRNILAKDFKEIVLTAGVKMVAITNHNNFDRIQFDEFKKEVGDEFILLPGIELDVIGLNNENGHIVIVYDDTDLNNFNNKINNLLINSTPDNFKVNIIEAIDFINNLNCIVLAHYYKCKPDALDLESITYMKEKIKDNFRFFYEPSNYRTLGIMINHNFRALKGTDISNWSDYEKQDFANIKLDIDSYKQLMLFLKKDETVIESLLNRQTKYSIDISYKKDKKEIIDIYDDVNIFFGTKGTGKSVSLEKILLYFKNKGMNPSYYMPNNNKDKLDEKLIILEEEKQLSNYGKENHLDKFLNINNWVQSNVTQFIDYINYVKYRDQNANKKRMKLVDIKRVLGYNSKILEKTKKDFDNTQIIISLLKDINVSRYISNEKKGQLSSLISELLINVERGYSSEFDEKMSIKLTNDAVKKIKSIIEKKTETKTIPDETGFTMFAKNLFSLEININTILSGFGFKKETAPEYVGVLEEGKILCKKTIVSMLNESSKADDGFSGITALKETKELLNSIKINIYTAKIEENLSLFKEKYKKGLSLDSFLGVVKKFVLGEEEYKPSSGEATMIILDESLNEDHDVYILDEPEKSLGNNYVSEILVNRLNDLAKMKKVVIVATHNANVAVRTLPYRSVLKVYDNGEYKTYVGNPYVNRLTNLENEKDTKNWKDESIRILEGGKEAFEERSDIYA